MASVLVACHSLIAIAKKFIAFFDKQDRHFVGCSIAHFPGFVRPKEVPLLLQVG